MPQASTALRLSPRTENRRSQAEQRAVTPRRAIAHRSPRIERTGGLFGRLCGALFDSDGVPHAGNGLGSFEKLPAHVLKQIFSYIVDPFHRASLLPTCRAMGELMEPYKAEFALFRALVKTRRSLEWHPKYDVARGVHGWMNVLSGSRWTDGIRRRALRDAIRRLIALQPYLPERAIREVFALFRPLQPEARAMAFADILRLLRHAPAQLAIAVLTEFAWRTANCRFEELDRQLFQHALPLWRNPVTQWRAEPAVGCIVMRYDARLHREDVRRWKQALDLLPTDATVQSDSVLGLAAYARRYQRDYPHGGLIELLLRRVGLPPPAAIAAFEERFNRMRREEWRLTGIQLQQIEFCADFRKYADSDSDDQDFGANPIGYS